MIRICFFVCLCLALGAGRPAYAQFDAGKTVPDFIAMCQDDDPEIRARCYGYVAGVLDFQRLAMQRLGIQGALFCPSAIVIADRVVPDYLGWVKAHPGAQIGVPSMSLYLYFQEKNPCPGVTPAEAAALGLPPDLPHIHEQTPEKPPQHRSDHDHPHPHP